MLCVALRGGSPPNWLQCDPSAWGGPQVCVAIVRVVAASADLRVPMPPRGKIPPGPQRERLFCYRVHYAQAGSLLSVATEAYVCELERRAPASGARCSAARDIVRGTYGEKSEVPEACLWASKTRSGLRSASFRNHRRVFDGTPGPGLRFHK